MEFPGWRLILFGTTLLGLATVGALYVWAMGWPVWVPNTLDLSRQAMVRGTRVGEITPLSSVLGGRTTGLACVVYPYQHDVPEDEHPEAAPINAYLRSIGFNYEENAWILAVLDGEEVLTVRIRMGYDLSALSPENVVYFKVSIDERVQPTYCTATASAILYRPSPLKDQHHIIFGRRK